MSRSLRSLLIWAGLILSSRLLVAVCLGLGLGWSELSDDVSFQLTYVGGPLSLLLGKDVAGGAEYLPPFPPMLPLVLWLLGQPVLSVLGGAAGTFLAMRVGFAVAETVAFVFTRRAMEHAGFGAGRVNGMSLLWLLAPVGWMSASVMVQEEAVGAAFAALVCLLAVRGKIGWALVACGFGVVAGKVYFLVPIAGLMLTGRWAIGTFLKNALLGFGPIVLGYSLAAVSWIGAGEVALASFTPMVEPTINLWGVVPVIQDVGDDVLKKTSAVPALLLGLLPALWWKWRHRAEEIDGLSLVRVLTTQWLWVFFSFYLVSPEYFLLALPGLMLVLNGRWAWGVVLGLLSIPWGTNFAYGVALAIDRAGGGEVLGGKGVFVRLWDAMVPIEPGMGHIAGLVVFSVGLGCLGAFLTFARMKPTPELIRIADDHHHDRTERFWQRPTRPIA